MSHGEKKRIGITRLHLEEDAGKSLHDGFPHSAEKTYVDFNRCGTPLSEIVSEPDMRTPDEAYAYLTTLRQILLYTGVSDCNMEEGSLRCDANVSVRLRGAKEFGTKVEVKNLNSFRYLAKALEYEIERHIGVVESGGRISQETRLWNQATDRTDPDALQGKGPRLSLFPGAGPAPCACQRQPGARKSSARFRSCLPPSARASSLPSASRPTTPKFSPIHNPWQIILKPWSKPALPAKPPPTGCKPNFSAA